jgi:hypothetical protein
MRRELREHSQKAEIGIRLRPTSARQEAENRNETRVRRPQTTRPLTTGPQAGGGGEEKLFFYHGVRAAPATTRMDTDKKTNAEIGIRLRWTSAFIRFRRDKSAQQEAESRNREIIR